MGIVVAWDGYISVSGTDLSDHCVQLTINDGQESREVTAMGDTSRRYRAAMGTASVDAVFLNDHSTGSVENILRAHLLAENTPSDKTPASSPTATAAALGIGNLSTGTYKYWVTYVYPAFETAPSTYASVDIATSTDSQVDLTSIPVSTDWFCAGRNIYRSIADGGTTTARLLTSITDNTATTYLDNATSSSIASADLVSLLWQAAGFDVVARKSKTDAMSTDNPEWTLTAVVDGDVNLLDDKPGEVGQIKVSFKPFNTFVMATT